MQSIDIFHIHEVWQYPQYIALRIAVRGRYAVRMVTARFP